MKHNLQIGPNTWVDPTRITAFSLDEASYVRIWLEGGVELRAANYRVEWNNRLNPEVVSPVIESFRAAVDYAIMEQQDRQGV